MPRKKPPAGKVAALGHVSSVKVCNFQSHEQSELVLHPGVNVVVGSSDHGKSSLYRALMWLANNTPTGQAFRSWWGGDTSVEVLFDDGTAVGRWRSKGFNGYTLGAQEYKSGAGVPPEIEEVINLAPVNWQAQRDPPYLLDESPPEVARVIQRAVDLTAINTAIQNIQARHALTLASIAGAEKRKRENEETAARLGAWVERAEPLVETAVALQAKYDALDEKVGVLDALVEKMEHARERSSKAQRVCRALGKHMAKATELQAQVEALAEKVSGISRVMLYMHRKRNEAAAANQRAKELHAEFEKLMPERCPLCERSG